METRDNVVIIVVTIPLVVGLFYLCFPSVFSSEEAPQKCVLTEPAIKFSNRDFGPHKFENCKGNQLYIDSTADKNGVSRTMDIEVEWDEPGVREGEGGGLYYMFRAIPRGEEYAVPCEGSGGKCSVSLMCSF
jgi:hypothetical protein